MGGHGGLNILPQKKWNVYRNDVQYKVNYDENKLIKEKGEIERKKNEHLFENYINELKNNINNNEGKIEYNEHINLFIEEEKEINRRKKLHEEYLIKNGHYIYNDNKFNGINCIYDKTNNTKIISDFDKIKISQNQWFLNRQKNVFLKNDGIELDNKNNTTLNKCYSGVKEKFLQKKTFCENEVRENDTDTFKYENKKKKESKNKYEHIKKLIKYKKEKEKKKNKRKKEKKMKMKIKMRKEL
ncbi:conserved Plasmodium protein, unknown function [Plasmodium gallinaceum]|uniref:CBF1-interacting co-repressor CIR N-terminal domain-containing protein n=1 Tax=Plasmodium gallinaceum TaxID=5849 RepID=A0A1J1GVQ8_PLAGA|nr:conserved Plasmodium protein, unknown function [Plasmodium gallinaceum]CRG95370.1 conserved Plasmodium protein, unknown function [Plasmodium gallinaceum]